MTEHLQVLQDLVARDHAEHIALYEEFLARAELSGDEQAASEHRAMIAALKAQRLPGQAA